MFYVSVSLLNTGCRPREASNTPPIAGFWYGYTGMGPKTEEITYYAYRPID